MDKAKSDHSDRMVKAASIKAEIDRTLAGVEEANAVLQVKNIITYSPCSLRTGTRYLQGVTENTESFFTSYMNLTYRVYYVY